MFQLKIPHIACVLLVFAGLADNRLLAATNANPLDITGSYTWKPVCIGAGGFVTGFTSSPSDSESRFARTDVGNAYRWDSATSKWVPMIVHHDDGSGFPSDVVPAPAVSGVESIAVDPSDAKKVYLATRFGYSSDLGIPGLGINVYKSIDGGRNFKARGNLNLGDDPNGNWRWTGERLKVDPLNGNILYFATMYTGLYRSVDGGLTWAQVSALGGPDPLSHVNSVQFDARRSLSTPTHANACSVLYAAQLRADSRYVINGGTWATGTFAGRKDVYIQSSNRPASTLATSCATAGSTELDDCIVTAEVAMSSTTNHARAGIIGRYQLNPSDKSHRDYYGLFVSAGDKGFRWVLGKSINDTFTQLQSGPLPYQNNSYLHLKLEITGDVLRAHVSSDGGNYILLGTISDANAPLRKGQFGLLTIGTTAAFANVSATHSAGLRYTSDFKGGDTRVWQDADVFRSTDAGNTWSNISAKTDLSHHCSGISAIDSEGNLWVSQDGAETLWRYDGSSWKSFAVGMGINGIAIDPHNPRRIFIEAGTHVARSLDKGNTWTDLGIAHINNRFAWLPQRNDVGRSDGGIYFDKLGRLWIPQGNEGVLTCTPSADDSETSNHPLEWAISSNGIEELVTQDVVLPPGGGDHAVVAVQDAQGMYISDPDSFTATQIHLAQTLISDGTSVAYCPNATNYLAISNSDIFYTGWPVHGLNSSGYSTDGGKTWQKFAAMPKYSDNGNQFFEQTGQIAVSARGSWGEGSDHLVFLPNYSHAPYYSKDGGRSWKQTTSFTDGGMWTLLKQRNLKADPRIADKYYLKTSYGPLWVSEDGGENWKSVNTTLPTNALNAQLEVNRSVSNDLWWVDGVEGAYAGNYSSAHGVWHSTNAGATFTRLDNVDNAITISLGAGRGEPGDAGYTVYIDGKATGDSKWGLFRSINAGATWDRIGNYPAGITDRPACMGASWDTFGLVYVGFNGNSFVYGKLNKAAAPVVHRD